MPKVSVIIPIYNVEKYLRECLDSVINQTLKDIEIICIDDGGKDNCPQIIDEYAQKDNRIIAVHKENGGYGHSCNTGLNRATGEYIAIVEPDDYIKPEMFEELYNNAVENRADLVKSNYIENYDLEKGSFQTIKPDNKEFVKPNKVFKLTEYPAFMLIHPSIWSCIYKKDFLDKHDIRFVEAPGAGWTDNPFQVQTMCLAEKISYIDKAYYYWRKTNIDDANDLKDITIPFKRSSEIMDWLNEQNINDNGIISFLLKRQLIYFHNINRTIKKSDISNYKKLLKDYTNLLDYEMIKTSTILKPREKRFLIKLKNSPDLAIFEDKFKVIKSNIFKLKINKNEQYLKIFGHYVWRKK